MDAQFMAVMVRSVEHQAQVVTQIAGSFQELSKVYKLSCEVHIQPFTKFSTISNYESEAASEAIDLNCKKQDEVRPSDRTTFKPIMTVC